MLTATKPSLSVLFDSAYDGQWNMDFDASLFRKQIQNSDENSILRFYRFKSPTLTIGYGMWKAAQGQLPMVRRLTGGGIVSHTPDDLTYALITPIASHQALKKVKDSYFFLHKVLMNSLNALGIDADLYTCHSESFARHPEHQRCEGSRAKDRLREESRDPSPDQPSLAPMRGALFGKNSTFFSESAGTGRTSGRPPLDQSAATPQDDTSCQKVSYCFDSPVLHDVMLNGKKIAGAGQKRSLGYLFHQGSIAWSEILREKPNLIEKDFCERFANDLAKEINLSVILSEAKDLQLCHSRLVFIKPARESRGLMKPSSFPAGFH